MFVVARNGKGRPMLMHRIADFPANMTACGRYIGGWSRSYFEVAIPVILCKRCGEG